jgi:hypothetical protein
LRISLSLQFFPRGEPAIPAHSFATSLFDVNGAV